MSQLALVAEEKASRGVKAEKARQHQRQDLHLAFTVATSQRREWAMELHDRSLAWANDTFGCQQVQ